VSCRIARCPRRGRGAEPASLAKRTECLPTFCDGPFPIRLMSTVFIQKAGRGRSSGELGHASIRGPRRVAIRLPGPIRPAPSGKRQCLDRLLVECRPRFPVSRRRCREREGCRRTIRTSDVPQKGHPGLALTESTRSSTRGPPFARGRGTSASSWRRGPRRGKRQQVLVSAWRGGRVRQDTDVNQRIRGGLGDRRPCRSVFVQAQHGLDRMPLAMMCVQVGVRPRVCARCWSHVENGQSHDSTVAIRGVGRSAGRAGRTLFRWAQGTALAGPAAPLPSLSTLLTLRRPRGRARLSPEYVEFNRSGPNDEHVIPRGSTWLLSTGRATSSSRWLPRQIVAASRRWCAVRTSAFFNRR